MKTVVEASVDAAGNSSNDEIVLKPVKIAHNDGRVETVYIEEHKQDSAKKDKAANFHRKLMLAYVVVGILALSLSAYVTARSLQKQ